MADQGDANVNIRLALERQALQEGKQGISDVSKQFDTLKAKIQDTGKSADGALVEMARSTSGLNDELADTIQKADKLGVSVQSIRRTGGALSQLGLGGLGSIVSRVGDILQVGKELQMVSEGAGAAMGGLVAEIAPLLPILAPVAIGIGGVTVALKLLDDSTALATSGLGRMLRTMEQFDKLTGGTTQQGFTGIEDNQKKIVEKQKDLARLQAEVDKIFAERQASQGDFAARIGLSRDKDYNDALAKIESLKHEITDLQSVSNDAFKAIQDGATQAADAEEKEAEAKKKLAEETARATAASKTLNDNFTAQMDARRKEAADTAAKEKAYKDQQISQAIAATEKYNDAVQSANDESAQKRLEIEKKYGDSLISIAQKAAQASQDALRALEQKREDINTSFGREADKIDRANAQKDLETQIKYQRQERDDLKAHLDSMRDIRRQSNQDEQDAIANRDFAQLAKLQQRKNQELDKENEKYSQQQQARIQALNDEKQDLTHQRAFEQNERLIAYNDQIQDAQRQYARQIDQERINRERQLQLAAQTRNEELRITAQALTNKLNLLASGYSQELKLAAMTSAERQRILINELNQARAMGFNVRQAQAISQTSPDTSFGSGGGVIRRFAGGGFMQAGQPGIVDEEGSTRNEGFSAGGRSIRFPGMGMFIPSQPGTVNKNAGGNSMVNHFYIQAHDTEGVRREVVNYVQQVMSV